MTRRRYTRIAYDLTEADWAAIRSVEIPKHIARLVETLQQTNNQGINAEDAWRLLKLNPRRTEHQHWPAALINKMNLLNTALRKKSLPYCLTFATRGGDILARRVQFFRVHS